MKHAIFVAATGQNVGKTTICLGLVAGLLKRFKQVGFIKPVGQQSVKIRDDVIVDKDVALFKEHFSLRGEYTYMSPVLIPKGYTRNYLDGKIDQQQMCDSVQTMFQRIYTNHDYTVVEGTGHSAVGSIIDMSNARVAADLGLDVILVISGGLGSAFDELALNKALFDQYGVSLRGVVLNRVLDEKREMVQEYFPKALQRWNIPLLGCIPYSNFLSDPSVTDLQYLFRSQLLAGKEYSLRHFRYMRMVATSADVYSRITVPNQLIVTSAVREDIILATIRMHYEYSLQNAGKDLEGGILLTGEHPPSPAITAQIRKANIPTLYTRITNYQAMEKLTSYTAKIRSEDTLKVRKASELVEAHIDFDLLLKPAL